MKPHSASTDFFDNIERTNAESSHHLLHTTSLRAAAAAAGYTMRQAMSVCLCGHHYRCITRCACQLHQLSLINPPSPVLSGDLINGDWWYEWCGLLTLRHGRPSWMQSLRSMVYADSYVYNPRWTYSPLAVNRQPLSVPSANELSTNGTCFIWLTTNWCGSFFALRMRRCWVFSPIGCWGRPWVNGCR